jgi:hypothetical protein
VISIFVRLVQNHFSFLILTSSSLSLFFINIIFKYKLEDQEYSNFALLLSIIGFVVVFGFLGVEQTFLRVIENNNKVLYIPKNNLRDMIFALLVFLFFSTFIMTNIYSFNLFFSISTILSLQIMTFVYLVLRIQHNWNMSQYFANGWKIGFLIAILIYYSISLNLDFVIVKQILMIILLIFLFFSIIMLIKINFIPVEFPNSELKNLNINFFISISLIAILSFADRFLIQSMLGEKIFSSYFYYLSIVFYPFSLLQGYIGFKELPAFKNNLNKNILKKKIKKIFILSLITTIFVFLLIWIINKLNIYSLLINDFILITLLILLGIVKLYYSLFSAVIGSNATAKNIFIINIKTITIIIFIITIILIFNNYFEFNIYFLTILFIIFWIMRCIFMLSETLIILERIKCQ